MFRTDYRVILRHFEFERLMALPSGRVEDFGGRYSNGLLASFYETDASKLNRTFRRLKEGQRTLYALNALCGQIDNGGITQFFFNVQPLLHVEVENALERVGAIEFLHEYLKVLESMRGNAHLAEIRRSATDWDDYLDYKSELGGEKSVNVAFDDWYFAGQAANLDRFMRRYIEGREGDFVRYCDEDRRLQARWTGQRLGDLVANFDDYRENADRGGSFGFFDSLFMPDLREGFGNSSEERRGNARNVAESLIPVIRRAARRPSIAAYADRPAPRISIDGGPRSGGHVVIQFHEYDHALRWSIAEWERPVHRS